MPHTTYRNRSIAYSSAGTGPAVVFIHGFGEDSRVWADFLPPFFEKYQTVTLDLPGAGASEPPAESTIEYFAEAVRTVVETLGLEKPVLIGHSMGGYVALAYAERYPLSGLGLFHSQPFADTEEKKEARRKSAEFVERQGSRPYVKELIPNLFTADFAAAHPGLLRMLVDRAAGFPPEGIAAALDAMRQRPDRSEVLRKADYPILFIIGEEDKAIPEENSYAQTHLPERALIHSLPGVAHMGMFEATEATQGMVVEFLAQCFSGSE